MVINMDIQETNQTNTLTNNLTTNINNNSKPKFTYDDILSSLNLEVSKNGVLQRMTIKSENSLNNNGLKNGLENGLENGFSSEFKPITNNNKIEPTVKNSYIYNKYFKQYNEGEEELIIPRIPKTREEYRQMVIEDLINRQQAKQRIAQIKSTKMMFTNNNNNNNHYEITPINVNRNNLNKLFRIK